jgi:hypothetical protein
MTGTEKLLSSTLSVAGIGIGEGKEVTGSDKRGTREVN